MIQGLGLEMFMLYRGQDWVDLSVSSVRVSDVAGLVRGLGGSFQRPCRY